MEQQNDNNRGFSLVEIIIVVAILSVMMGVVGYGFNMVNGKPAEKYAKKFAAAISNARTNGMGKYGNEIVIKNDGGTLKVIEHIKIGAGDSDVVTTTSVIGTVGGNSVTVKYKGATGGFTKVLDDDDDDSSITIKYDSGSGAMKEPYNCTGFLFTKAGNDWYVHLGTLTGSVKCSKSESPNPVGVPDDLSGGRLVP